LFTDYPNILLPTVLSRLQKIKFFPQKKKKFDNKRILEELEEIERADIIKRFQYIEMISRSPKIQEILTEWLYYFREKLINDPDPAIAKILSRIQETILLISQTNINPRLALENLILEF